MAHLGATAKRSAAVVEIMRRGLGSMAHLGAAARRNAAVSNGRQDPVSTVLKNAIRPLGFERPASVTTFTAMSAP